MKTSINKDAAPQLMRPWCISLISCVLLIFLSNPMFAQEFVEQRTPFLGPFYDGIYLGATVGYQNVFGEADIEGLDLIVQKSALVLEFSTGYRRQFVQRLVVGAEVQIGYVDGDMEEFDERFQMDVHYQNSIQTGYGLTAGLVIGGGKNFLTYGYGNVTNRNFEIEYTDVNGTVHNQEDDQRFLQYGVGADVHVEERFNVRASVGKVNVDFEDVVASQDVEDEFDFRLGLVYQF
jgi:outer membrane autotransporter protein